jgi:phage-related protein
MALPSVHVVERAAKEISKFSDPRAIDIAKERIEEIRQYGIRHLVKAGEAERMKSDQLDEIKIKGNKTEFRLLGSAVPRNMYFILHGFRKTSRKIDQYNKKVAKQRKAEIIKCLSLM